MLQLDTKQLLDFISTETAITAKGLQLDTKQLLDFINSLSGKIAG